MSKITKSKVLENLSPMYNVMIEPAKGGKAFIVKDGVKFGFIQNKNLYFMNETGNFVQLMDAISKPDDLLLEATKSFWHARARDERSTSLS